MPDTEVDIIDCRAPFPFNILSKIMRIELLQALRALIHQHEYDLIVSHSFNSAFVFSLIRSVFSKRKPRHFVIDVGSLNGGKEDGVQIAMLRIALKSVTGLIYHSTVNEEFYARHFPGIARRFVAFGTDLDQMEPNEPGREGDYAISIGHAFRDYSTLTEAWSRIDYPLKIVGTAELDVGGLQNIQLIPRTSIDRTQSLIRDSRFVILPITNVRYSIGQMTLTQCMALMKPLIVSKSFGVIDYCEDGVNCLMFECGKISEIVDKVRFLLDNPEKGREIAARARHDVEVRFNEKVMAAKIYEFIK